MQKIILANWKSHKVQNQVGPWFSAVGAPPAELKLIVLPPATLFPLVSAQLPAGVALGAQNCSPFPLGAYTGEIAAAQLADLGVTHCLVGHSERRTYFGETNERVVAKCQLLQEAGVAPIVCVDEPYLEMQLTALEAAGVVEYMVAYEPIAAIGSGHSLPLDQVQKALTIARTFGDFPFLYGGSVSAADVAEYLLVCDGALVGTASLEGATFAQLLAVAAAQQPSFSM